MSRPKLWGASDVSNIGEGVVYRVAVQVQRRFWTPPHIEKVRRGAGKYR